MTEVFRLKAGRRTDLLNGAKRAIQPEIRGPGIRAAVPGLESV